MKSLLLPILVLCSCIAYTQGLDSIRLEQRIHHIQENINLNPEASKKMLRDLYKNELTPYFESMIESALGEVFLIQNNCDSAQVYLEKSLETREKYNYLPNLASTHESFAKLFSRIGETESAFYHLYRSLSIKRIIGNLSYLAPLYNSLGSAHFAAGLYDSAYFYYKNANSIYKEESDTQGVAATLSNMGNVLYMLDQNYEAIDNYRSSLNWYKTAGRHAESVGPLYNISSVYGWLEVTDSSYIYLSKALDLAKETANLDYLELIYIDLAKYYLKSGESDSAVMMVENYVVYRDSIFSKGKVDAILEFQEKFETQETEKKLLKSELTSKKRQQLNYMLLSIFGIATLIAFFLIRNYRQKKKLSELELNVKNKEIDNLLKVQEAKSYAALLEGQSAERVRIAQDLHDHLGATLSAVKIQFEAMDQQIEQLKGENKKQFAKMTEMINEAVKDVRRISHDLSSGKLAEQGLRGVLNDMAEIINTSNRLRVSFYMDDKIRNMPHKVEKELYAVIQEAMSNVLKHAQANHVDLQLNLQDDIVNVIIEDDGIGFAMDDAKDKGLGIQGMSNRLKKVNGEINFDSKIGRGTIIIINIPYDSNSADR